jgi:hypothetical protein
MDILKIKSQIKSPYFNVILKNLKIVPKLFEIRFCKIVNQIVEYPAFNGVIIHFLARLSGIVLAARHATFCVEVKQ